MKKEIVDSYRAYLEVTDGDKAAAAMLTLASVRLDTGRVIEHMADVAEQPEVGSFATGYQKK